MLRAADDDQLVWDLLRSHLPALITDVESLER
jgi:hypothetical protein